MKKLLIGFVIATLLIGLVGCASQTAAPTVKVSQGFGLVNTPRLGPGKDDTDTQVYSINQVFVNALFDAEGKIVALYIDELEVATPNYDGAGMPHFSGFPGQSGYNNDANHDGVVEGVLVTDNDNFQAEINGWVTKRERGDSYHLNTGNWATQMDKYQELFVGKTVAEVEEWFNKYTAANGRPLKDGLTNEQDKAKYDALTADEKAMLADVTTSATISLRDAHGDFVGAIKKAYENRVEIEIAQ